MAEEQKKLQALTEEYQKIQDDLNSTIVARQKLESQQTENKSVKAEFDSLASDSQIYKLIGPVLLKQEKNEAMMSVNGRLEFIDKEIKRIEGQINELNQQGESKKMEVMKVQSGLQQQTAKAG